MEVDDVEVAVERSFEPSLHQERPAGQVGREGREQPDSRVDRDYAHAWVARLAVGPRVGERAVSLTRVNDRDVVAPVRERDGEPLDLDRVTAERERRVEGRQHAEAKRPRHAAAFHTRSRRSRAAASHERPATACRPRSPSELRRPSSRSACSRCARNALPSVGEK